ncbi:MAG: MFS transporter, partial [Parageobacillus thermoglucosidasius]|nr:MFS transporter [Parageobacillus thermoglucosidasius]
MADGAKGGLKATITVAMSNYLEAGSIVAGAGGLSLWVEYLKLDDIKVGLLGAVSANGFGSAVGAFIGGILV